MTDWNPKRPEGWEKVRVKRGHPHGAATTLTGAAVATKLGRDLFSEAAKDGRLPVTDPDGRTLEQGRVMDLLVEEQDLNKFLESIGKPTVQLPRKRDAETKQESLPLPQERSEDARALASLLGLVPRMAGTDCPDCPSCRGRRLK